MTSTARDAGDAMAGREPSERAIVPNRARFPVLLYALTTFLSAFLLFQVQPLIGKYILPWFGGGSTVWTTTMLFFQVALLGGYAYAHFISSRLSPHRQGLLHLVLLIVAIAALPIIPREALRPEDEASPTWHILVLLTITVGAPYLLLSSTAPLIQRWFTHDHPGTSPYRLYALSNTGSLLALLTYPILFERFIGLRAQAWLWSGGYVVFVLLCGTLAWGFLRSARRPAAQSASDEVSELTELERPIRTLDIVSWLVLPACASAMLLATTNQLTQDVASIPLLWVVPLSLYLLTFIICFGDDRAYRPLRDVPLLALALGGGVYIMDRVDLEVLWQILFYSFTLFMCCFALHGEMVRLRPGPRHLTAFYLMVSVGGAIGGVFVALVAPVIFNGYWEYQLMLGLTPLLVLAARALDVRRQYAAGDDATGKYPRELLAAAGLAAVGGIAVLGVFLLQDVRESGHNLLERDRNFYGSVRVFEFNADSPEQAMVIMEHGRILHGFQYTAPEKRQLASAYYGPNSGVGVVLRHYPKAGEFSAGVIGLGAGMVAAYAQPDEDWRFYEINPMVTELAERHFTYLEDARDRGVHLHILHGDGRSVLERQVERSDGQLRFDVLILDAFTSDAIPVHLLTREAFDLYWNALEPEGVLAINISNRHVDLSPVVRKAAEVNGKEAHWVSGRSGDGEGVLDSVWMIVTSNRAFLDNPDVRVALAEWPANARAPRLWTDDFSNVYSLMRLY